MFTLISDVIADNLFLFRVLGSILIFVLFWAFKGTITKTVVKLLTKLLNRSRQIADQSTLRFVLGPLKHFLAVSGLYLGSYIAFQHRVRYETAFTTIPDKPHAGTEGTSDFVSVQLRLAHIIIAQHFCGEVLLHQAGQNPHFHFGGSVCGKIKVRFGQTFVIAQIEKVPSIDAGFPQLEACHVQKVANIERDLQTMDILVLVGGDEQQASERIPPRSTLRSSTGVCLCWASATAAS